MKKRRRRRTRRTRRKRRKRRRGRRRRKRRKRRRRTKKRRRRRRKLLGQPLTLPLLSSVTLTHLSAIKLQFILLKVTDPKCMRRKKRTPNIKRAGRCPCPFAPAYAQFFIFFFYYCIVADTALSAPPYRNGISFSFSSLPRPQKPWWLGGEGRNIAKK